MHSGNFVKGFENLVQEDAYEDIQGVPLTTVFFQRHTAPTKIFRFQKFLYWQVGNELTFMWLLFVAA